MGEKYNLIFGAHFVQANTRKLEIKPSILLFHVDAVS